MAYATTNPPSLIASGLAGVGQVWHYTSADAIATVDGTGYISNGQALGMKLNDTVFVVDTGNGITSTARVESLHATDGSVDLADGTTVGTATDTD